MASEISPKAEIATNVKIGDNCKIYPFAYIEEDVVIGDNCIIYPFTSVLTGTRMGNNNQVFQGSVLGAIPQDFNYNGAKTELIIGNDNIIRENVVINRATYEGGQTIIGNNNFLMEGSHISHDTKVGDYCVFGYGSKIAGDCVIGDYVVLSSSVIENAKTRVGSYAMVQAGTTFSKDVPPYIIAGGNPVQYTGTNKVIMEQAHFDPKVQKHIANAYRLLFHGQTSVEDGIYQIKQQVPPGEEIDEIIEFLGCTKNGLMTKL